MQGAGCRLRLIKACTFMNAPRPPLFATAFACDWFRRPGCQCQRYVASQYAAMQTCRCMRRRSRCLRSFSVVQVMGSGIAKVACRYYAILCPYKTVRCMLSVPMIDRVALLLQASASQLLLTAILSLCNVLPVPYCLSHSLWQKLWQLPPFRLAGQRKPLPESLLHLRLLFRHCDKSGFAAVPAVPRLARMFWQLRSLHYLLQHWLRDHEPIAQVHLCAGEEHLADIASDMVCNHRV